MSRWNTFKKLKAPLLALCLVLLAASCGQKKIGVIVYTPSFEPEATPVGPRPGPSPKPKQKRPPGFLRPPNTSSSPFGSPASDTLADGAEPEKGTLAEVAPPPDTPPTPSAPEASSTPTPTPIVFNFQWGTPSLTEQCQVEWDAQRTMTPVVAGATPLQTLGGVDVALYARDNGFSFPVTHSSTSGNFLFRYGWSLPEGVATASASTQERSIRLSREDLSTPLRLPTQAEGSLWGGLEGTTVPIPLPTEGSCVTCASERSPAQIEAGRSTVCLKTDQGELSCWGANSAGQLGIGTTQNAAVPQRVLGLPAPVRRVSLREDVVCAVLQNNELWCWGNNQQGYLNGGASTSNLLVPHKLEALGAEVATASVGQNHFCAVLLNGTLKCWGNGGDGRLGLGTTTSHTSPTTVSLLDEQSNPVLFESVSASVAIDGQALTCATSRTGRAYCWGVNYQGTVGDGTTTERRTPTPVLGLESGVLQVTPSSYVSTCALRDTGRVWCWGNNHAWDSPTPVEVPGLGNDVVAISSGEDSCGGCAPHMCALNKAGEALCWGMGSDTGMLNPNEHDLMSSSYYSTVWDTPTKLPFSEPLQALSAGAGFTCGIGRSGAVYCLGQNKEGIRGDGVASFLVSEPTPVHPEHNFDTLWAAGLAICGAKGTGLWCWGIHENGTLGPDTAEPSFEPVQVGAFASPVVKVVSGIQSSWHSGFHCALLQNGEVYCWGGNGVGNLGIGSANGTTLYAPTTKVVGLPTASDVVAGGAHVCAVASGKLYCWGANSNGQLGLGDSTNRAEATEVTGAGTDVTHVVASSASTCVRKSAASSVLCWGARGEGHVGQGATTGSQLTPLALTALSSGVSALTSSGTSFCALQAGVVKCWGRNNEKQAGQAMGTAIATPTAVTVPGTQLEFVPIRGTGTTCVSSLDVDNAPLTTCWGQRAITAAGVTLDTLPTATDFRGLTDLTMNRFVACGLQAAEWKCFHLEKFIDQHDVPLIFDHGLRHVPKAVRASAVDPSPFRALLAACVQWLLQVLP